MTVRETDFVQLGISKKNIKNVKVNRTRDLLCDAVKSVFGKRRSIKVGSQLRHF